MYIPHSKTAGGVNNNSSSHEEPPVFKEVVNDVSSDAYKKLTSLFKNYFKGHSKRMKVIENNLIRLIKTKSEPDAIEAMCQFLKKSQSKFANKNKWKFPEKLSNISPKGEHAIFGNYEDSFVKELENSTKATFHSISYDKVPGAKYELSAKVANCPSEYFDTVIYDSTRSEKYSDPSIISEMCRVLDPEGSLLVKFYNADGWLIDIHDKIENCVHGTKIPKSSSIFPTEKQLLSEFSKYDLKLAERLGLTGMTKNPLGYFVLVLKKVDAESTPEKFIDIRFMEPLPELTNYSVVGGKGNRQGHPVPFSRIFLEEHPRMKYKSRAGSIKHTLHWGQRKLHLSEIEFLTIYYDEYHKKGKKVILVYAGAAAGTHLIHLSEMFPEVQFKLYDPRPFDKNLDTVKQIETFNQLFLDEDAKQWNSKEYPNTDILLVSDIRTGEPGKMTSGEVNERVSTDHEWQKNWYRLIKPTLTLLKFRLPWDTGKTPYLEGDIYIQVWAPHTSTETRLLVKGPNAKIVQYDNTKYEEQLMYFNNISRVSNYPKDAISGISINFHSPKLSGGLSNKYDSMAEIKILYDYLLFADKKMRKLPNSKKVSKVVELSKRVSKILHKQRTLMTGNILKLGQRDLLIHLRKVGLIPITAPINYGTYEKYVTPNIVKWRKDGFV
jgi:hypothetical protein